ncbi:MAG: glycosyltransferase [Nocardioides sp.]
MRFQLRRDRAARKSSPAPRKRARARKGGLLRTLQDGVPLQEGVSAEVRRLLAAKDVTGATALAESLRAQPQTEELGRLVSGIVAAHRGCFALAWEHLRGQPVASWTRFAAAEYVRSGLATSPEETLAQVAAVVDGPPATANADTWFEMLRPVYGYGDEPMARRLFSRLEAAAGSQARVRAPVRKHLNWLRPWLNAEGSSPMAPPSESPTFAVIDYRHPNVNAASSNIGDHIQSIASLTHLVRHQGVRLHGDPALVGLLERLRSRIRPEQRRDDIEADLNVMTVQRDASMYDEIPEGTWALCFGWYMSPLFGMRFGFPLHRALRPVFVSFHCNQRGLLTSETVDYLRRYGPIGCRDWTTVYLLLSMGIPAFFSGCITTTIDAVFPDLDAPAARAAPKAYVDVPASAVPPGATTYTHAWPEVATRSFAENCDDAVELLETYRRQHSGLTTSRLHCYLPVRSLGVDVDFQPSNRSDVRFDGLMDITDGQFDEIRDGIRAKLEQVLALILSGAPEDEVYALWRDITADEVQAAEKRLTAPLELSSPRRDVVDPVADAVADAVRHSRTTAGSETHGSTVHCAVRLPQGRGRALEVLVSSLVENSSHDLHVWVLADHGTARLQERFQAAWPSVGFTWIPTGGLSTLITSPDRNRPVDLTNVVLCDLVHSVDRLVVLPVDALVTGDIAELRDLDLGENLLAAPTRNDGSGASGFHVINKAALRLGPRTRLSASLRRTAHARHEFDFDAYATEVMVLDVQRLRQQGFAQEAVSLIAEFDLTDVEVFHYFVGPSRAVVPPSWWQVPTRHPSAGAGLIHWADEAKPWGRNYTPGRELWRGQLERVQRGSPEPVRD